MATLGLDALMKAAGASLGDAQSQLMTGVEAPPTVMAIAEATLEMKVTVDGASGSALRVAPVSAADARAGAINVGALSSVTMRFVAFGHDTPGQVASPAGAATDPARGGKGEATSESTRDPAVGAPLTREAAIKVIERRADVARHIAAGERIRSDTVQIGIAPNARWVVTARAPGGDIIAALTMPAKV